MIRRALQSGFDSDIDCELGLEPGTYVYHFAFQLPTSGLYTSFSSTPAKVRYVIEVRNNFVSIPNRLDRGSRDESTYRLFRWRLNTVMPRSLVANRW